MDAEGNSPTFPHLRGLKEGDVASSRIKQVGLRMIQNNSRPLPQSTGCATSNAGSLRLQV